MRNLLVIFLALFLFSCQDDEQAEPLLLTDNTFTAQRNNVKWSGVTEIRLDEDTDSLTFIGIANAPNDEVILMKIKFKGPGSYPLIKHQAKYYTTVGSDVITNQYKLAPNSVGQLIVTKYNTEEKSIEGSFDVMLEKEWSYSENQTTQLHLTDGHFNGNIQN